MSRLFLGALLVVLLLGPNAGATEQNPRALPEVRVVDTDPPAGQNLSRNWPLYIHLRYESEAPLRVQVKGFFQGIEVTDGVSWNPSPPILRGRARRSPGSLLRSRRTSTSCASKSPMQAGAISSK